jgi:hypothetical protein
MCVSEHKLRYFTLTAHIFLNPKNSTVLKDNTGISRSNDILMTGIKSEILPITESRLQKKM